MGKRGQFFLLAAVIISVVVLSLSVTTNRAIVNEEPGSFYDYSYEVHREVGAVVDYGVYTDIDGDFDGFVELLSEDIKKKNPKSNFVLVYGEGANLSVKKYGTEDVSANGEIIPDSGKEVKTNIKLKGKVGKETSTEITEPDTSLLGDFGGGEIVIEFDGNDYTFPVTDYNQVIFIMQKDVGDEKFITTG